ncbi:CbtA family protein [Hyphomicrobium sp.]|jgi:predicted cobalt transporter CbtA|uniref:CbtA family protein n=1 Tax=Hyphomicrobium sp. TaxID=82 RepID=UPI002BEA8867|nr:CbtA family protein [Hyphomicrobium sp.]HVZ03999.1 CbtA family protein [Hyphomicrobium sp.]
MGQLLLRGMLAGLLAAVLAFGFAKIAGEPQVDRAIGFEESHHHAEPGEAEEPELVSRPVQAGIGLATGIAVYGTALGGLFALAFAFINGRLLQLSPRTTAIVIAGLGFLVFYVVPNLKYPANPPAVGAPDTIGYRTQLYFTMIVFSAAALAIAIAFGRQLAVKLGAWNATIAGALAYLVLVGIAAFMLPPINEVPATFPADLLWNFRVASLGIQAILWTTIGLAFGALTERSQSAQTA